MHTKSSAESYFRRIGPGLWRIGALVLATLAAGLVHLKGEELPGVRVLEATARDAAMRLMARSAEDPRLAIVDIDEDSLRLHGPWPWPRDRLADLAERLLSEAGAHRVVFDLVMPTADTVEPVGDQRLAALAREGLLVLGQALDYEERASPVSVGEIQGGRPLKASRHRQPAASGFVGNHPVFLGARCVGNIGVQPDFDGRIRRLQDWTTWKDQEYPALSVAALTCGGATAPELDAWFEPMPRDEGGAWRVPFRHRADAHLAVPAHEVLSGAVDVQGGSPLLAGRLVLVGSSALGLADRVSTPMAANVSGVTVHAEALSWLLDAAQGTLPPRPPPGVMLLWALLSGLMLAGSVMGQRSGVGTMTAAGLLSVSGWGALTAWVSLSGDPQAVATPLVAGVVLMLVLLPAEWAGAQGRARRQGRLLGRYVAPSVLRELQRLGDVNALEPRRAAITVLIADMQDYTRNTAAVPLKEAAVLTKGFLEALTEPVLAVRGTLDRYTGDGLVAFWGAPIAQPDHADLAVQAALDIGARVAEFNARRLSLGLQPVQVRMGLASGDALVGDLGTRFRISYTAVGDCINLASRLQQASREVGVDILVADSVRQACTRHAFHDLGIRPVRGLPDQRVATPARGRATPPSDAVPAVAG